MRTYCLLKAINRLACMHAWARSRAPRLASRLGRWAPEGRRQLSATSHVQIPLIDGRWVLAVETARRRSASLLRHSVLVHVSHLRPKNFASRTHIPATCINPHKCRYSSLHNKFSSLQTSSSHSAPNRTCVACRTIVSSYSSPSRSQAVFAPTFSMPYNTTKAGMGSQSKVENRVDGASSRVAGVHGTCFRPIHRLERERSSEVRKVVVHRHACNLLLRLVQVMLGSVA